jgi:ribosomal protein S18 acetylase RimI-like enzyme
LILRPAILEDVPSLVALVNSAYRGDSSRVGWTTEADLLGGQRIDSERLAETITQPDQVVLVHERGDGPLACVLLERVGDSAYLGLLTVRPTAQGDGIGRQLLTAAEKFVSEAWQSRSIHMTVIVQRSELIAWYERCGYHRTGEFRPFPYGDERSGLPKRSDLQFEVLRKILIEAQAVAGVDGLAR